MAHNQGFSRIVFSRYHSFPRAPIFLWVIFLFFCLFPPSALAGEVTLAWDPPSTEYGGFILAYGTSSGSYSNTQDVGTQATYTVTSLNPGQTYYFSVKAYNAARDTESPYSNQVSATLPSIDTTDTTPPASPKNVQIH
jgi:hypothetical protein